MRPIIGLIGQVCAGKSAVAAIFRSNGALVWDADKAVHSLYQQPNVICEISQLFPDAVENNLINKKKLAAIVFFDAGQLKILTNFLSKYISKSLSSVLDIFKKI